MPEPVSIDMSVVAENLANRVGVLTLQLAQLETAVTLLQAQVDNLQRSLQESYTTNTEENTNV